MRVLAIDPAIRNTGYAVIEGHAREARALEYGTLSIPQSRSQSECLLLIHERIGELITSWQPDELAIEQIIYVQSHRTAITMDRPAPPSSSLQPGGACASWNTRPHASNSPSSAKAAPRNSRSPS